MYTQKYAYSLEIGFNPETARPEDGHSYGEFLKEMQATCFSTTEGVFQVIFTSEKKLTRENLEKKLKGHPKIISMKRRLFHD
jgi:hypothetical protein